jgi:uncharacterized protein (TIGR02145 family)
MKLILLLSFILFSIIVLGQTRKIEKRVYSNYREGKFDLALQELEDLSSKFEENAFFHYWKAYIYMAKINQMKKMEWVELNRNVCLNLIQNTNQELDLALIKLTINELSFDKEGLMTLFPGCIDKNFIDPDIYINCPSCRTNGVDARNAKELKKKFNEYKEYISQLYYNVNLVETANQYISGKPDIESFIISIRSRVKDNPSKNPLDGEMSKQLFLDVTAIRNKIVLAKMKDCDQCLLSYLKTKKEEEFLSIVPEIEKIINSYYFKRFTDRINNNHKDAELVIGGYNMYIETLKTELQTLNSNPTQFLIKEYGFSGFSTKFIEERKVLCNQTIQLAIQKKEEYIIAEMNRNAIKISKEIISENNYGLKDQLTECEEFITKYQRYNSYDSYGKIRKRKEDIIAYLNALNNAINKEKEFNSIHQYENVIKETFENNNKLEWTENENENLLVKLNNNTLKIYSKKSLNINSICRFKLTPGEDLEINEFLLSTSTEWKSGSDNDNFGIIFGAQGILNYYCFGISANGNYNLCKFTNGSYTNLIALKPSTEIKQKGKNVISVIKNRETIELYINYIKVDNIILTDFFGEEIGLNVSGNQEVEFKDYVVSYNLSKIYKEIKYGAGPIIKDIDGNSYKTTYIGTDHWIAENLNVSKFRNGELIPQAKSAEEWDNAYDQKKPCWCYLNFNATNGKIFGKLYNWYAVNDSRGLAPDGWHVASSNDYSELLSITKNGNDLKSKTRWKLKNGLDKYGFSALPGFSLDFYIGYSGHYRYGADRWTFFSDNYQSDRTEFWTSTHDPLDFESQSIGFQMYDNEKAWLDEHSLKSKGKYVRCVKD